MPGTLHPFVDSTDLLKRPEELRRRMRREGYLYFGRLLPAERVLRLRRLFLDACRRHDWLPPGTDPLEGRTTRAPTEEGAADYWPVYREIQLSEDFHLLAHDETLVGTVAQILDEEVFVHPMKIGRISFPNNVRATTPEHQDYVHIQGSFQTYTSWIPLGDVPEELGGLAVLAGSHKLGVLEPRAAEGAGGLGLDTQSYALPWHGGAYRTGDVLIFPCTTVHKALPNLTRDHLRLSVDYRFTGISHGVAETNLRLHYSWELPELTFENLYRGWKTESLKYYWKRMPIRIVPFTDAWHQSAYAKK